MKTITYGGIEYHVSDAIARRMLFYHELAARIGVKVSIEIPAHTDDALDTWVDIELSADEPLPTPAEYQGRAEPHGSEGVHTYFDEIISSYLNYLNVEVEGHYDLSIYAPNMPAVVSEMEDRWRDLLRDEPRDD